MTHPRPANASMSNGARADEEATVLESDINQTRVLLEVYNKNQRVVIRSILRVNDRRKMKHSMNGVS